MVVRPPSWPQFAAWVACGASTAFVLAGAFTVGVFAVPAAAVFAVLALRFGGANASAFGAMAGAGVWVFVLGWLNRGGPGEVCTTTSTGGSCEQQWAPEPFWVVGAVLVLAAVLAFVHARRARRG